MKYILFDTETTGNGENDRIIQLALMVINCEIDEKKPQNSLFDTPKIEIFSELNSSEKEISFEAMEVHNITPEMIENQPEIHERMGYKRLCELNSDENYLIAHNIKFDLSMLEKENFSNKFRLIDTLKCARAIYKDFSAHRLQYLRYRLGLYKIEKNAAKEFGINIKAHDALGDVLVLKLLLDEMLKTHSLEQLHELTKQPLLIEKFPFGKYKDRLIREICLSDASYISWCLQNLGDNEDLIYSIKKYQNS